MLNVLVRRGADFATAEDAVQEAILKALTDVARPIRPAIPRDGWSRRRGARSSTVARSESARRGARAAGRRDSLRAGEVPSVDDTLRLYFLCAHPALTPASAVALTLRAVGGLTTAQIAQAYLVPEATMAQRISRAKRSVSDLDLDQPGDLATVMHVLYLVFNEGYSGDVDLAAEAIRLTRQLATMIDDPEVGGSARADAPAPRSPRCSDTTRRKPGDVGRAGPQPLGRGTDRRGGRAAAGGARARSARRVSGPSRDRRAPRGCRNGSRRPTGCRSSAGTTSCSDSPTRRSCDSTAPSPSARPTAAPAGLAALAEVADDVPRRSAVAAHLHERNGDLHRRHACTPTRPATHRACRSEPTRPVRPPRSTNCYVREVCVPIRSESSTVGAW